MGENYYAQDLWDEGYKNFNFFTAGNADPVKQFIIQNINSTPGTCFEVGCFPGRYLAVLGNNGWQLNGIDETLHLPTMVEWLKSMNYKTDIFIQQNFEEYQNSLKYDLVYSCGFIEHFSNFEEVISKHLLLVKENGKIIITTPNFNGIQGFLHRFLDYQNYKRHNIESMNLKKWNKVLVEQGFIIEKQKYFGKFAFWYGWQPRPYYKRFFLFRFMKIVPFLKHVIFFDSKTLSPFCGIVAKKPVNDLMAI